MSKYDSFFGQQGYVRSLCFQLSKSNQRWFLPPSSWVRSFVSHIFPQEMLNLDSETLISSTHHPFIHPSMHPSCMVYLWVLVQSGPTSPNPKKALHSLNPEGYNKGCVITPWPCHFTLKRILRQKKKNYGNLKYFTMQKYIIFPKKSFQGKRRIMEI